MSVNIYDGTNLIPIAGKTVPMPYTPAPQSMIGDAWVASHAYAVGDYCIDGNVLYKCKTAHTSSASYRPPYASYWDALSVANELNKLNDKIPNRFDIYTTESYGSAYSGSFKNNITISKYNNLGTYTVNSYLGCLELKTTTTGSLHRGFFKINRNFSDFLGKGKVIFVNHRRPNIDYTVQLDCANSSSSVRPGWGNNNGSSGNYSIPLDSVISASYPYIILSLVGPNSGTDEVVSYINNIYII